MPNSYFRFKQFTIQQDHCAMKVCTDACLFGAWAANTLKEKSINPVRILDIGAGTGLLSLMFAQQFNPAIDAVEIDENAAKQAGENFAASPWTDRLRVIHTDIKQLPSHHQYDFIISNPPFFENDLKSDDRKRNLALHSAMLGLKELLVIMDQLLTADGYFAVLLPYRRKNEMIELAERFSFYVSAIVNVKQTESHDYFRVMLLMGRNRTAAAEHEIIIKVNDQYAEPFIDLLKDYYLNF